MENGSKVTIKLVTPTTLVLFALFFLAKIFDKIDWNWWWVFSPLWIPFAVIFFIIIGWVILLVLATFLDYLIELKNNWKNGRKS